jgi:hypothetical protein
VSIAAIRRHPPGGCGGIASVPTLRVTQDPAADDLLGRDPLALLLGMLFDQHMRPRSSDTGCRSRCRSSVSATA